MRKIQVTCLLQRVFLCEWLINEPFKSRLLKADAPSSHIEKPNNKECFFVIQHAQGPLVFLDAVKQFTQADARNAVATHFKR